MMSLRQKTKQEKLGREKYWTKYLIWYIRGQWAFRVWQEGCQRKVRKSQNNKELWTHIKEFKFYIMNTREPPEVFKENSLIQLEFQKFHLVPLREIEWRETKGDLVIFFTASLKPYSLMHFLLPSPYIFTFCRTPVSELFSGRWLSLILRVCTIDIAIVKMKNS